MMASRSTPPGAAYIYTLQLDPPGLAWEYLRRDPNYRKAWRRQSAEAPTHWNIEIFEDPDLDSRFADPIWSPAPASQIHLTNDSGAPAQGRSFSLWRIPGSPRLFHDGRHVSLSGIDGPFGHRATLGDHFHDGAPHSYAVRPAEVADTIAAIKRFERMIEGKPATAHAPSRHAVAHMRALQALDAVEAGCSERDIGALIFGAAVLANWHSESPVRAMVRDAVKRGHRYRSGHWRSLLRTRRQRRFHKAAQSP